jgi:hypothetical protein
VSVVLVPERYWRCPNCPAVAVTRQARPHTEFHPCPGLGGLNAPMVPAGMDCKVTVVAWGDMLHGELAQRDADGRPVSAVVTTRADGSNDTAVLAPSARWSLED